MPSLRFHGIPFGAAVDMTATQGANSSTYTDDAWGVPPAPVNLTAPNITGSSLIGQDFDIDDGTWSGVVSSYEYRLKLDGAIEAGITSFPTTVLAAWDGKVPTFGIRAIGPGLNSAWVEVTGPAVSYSAPSFSVQPTLSSAGIVAGDVLTLNLGVAGPSATLSVEVFTLGGVDKRGELTGSGATRTWDSTGEPSGLISFRVRADNGNATLSNIVTANLIGSGGAFYPASVTLSATAGLMEVINLEGLGAQDSLTINSISQGRITRRSDAKHSLDLTDFSAAGTITIGYTAVKSGFSNITGVCTVNMAEALQANGWGVGAHWYFPVNGSNEFVIEPGRNHRKVYVSTSALSGGDLVAAGVGSNTEKNVTVTKGAPNGLDLIPSEDVVSIVSVTQGNPAVTFTGYTLTANQVDWSGVGTEPAEGSTYTVRVLSPTIPASTLFGNVVPGGLGGNGTWKYGEDPAVAISTQLARTLWNYMWPAAASGSVLLPASHWILFKRGENFGGTDFSAGGKLKGESALHPVLVGAYGSGANPIVSPPTGGMTGTEFVVVQNIQFAERGRHATMRAVAFDGVTASGENGTGSGSTFIAFGDCFVLRRGKFTDIALEKSKNTNPAQLIWNENGDATDAFFSAEYTSNLVEDVFADIAGWGEYYSPAFLKTSPQPPSFYSHVAYFAGEPTGSDETGPVVNDDVTLRRSTMARGALTGFQFRMGGVGYENSFFGNNSGIMLGGGGEGVTPGTKKGNYSLFHDNLVTWAGQKTLMRTGTMAGGYTFQGKGVSVINNILCHSGAGNDGVTAYGEVTEFTSGTPWHTIKDENAVVFYNDTKIRKWVATSEDANLGGLTLGTLDATTLEAYAESWLGEPTNRRDLMLAIRNEVTPWAKVRNDILPYFQTAFQATLPAPGGITTRTFRPDGRTPGMRWDVRFDWVGGVVPQAGDSVNLTGHRVNMFDNQTINALDLQGGELIQHGGRLTVTSLASAGTLTQRQSGQFFMSGYSGAPVITVNSQGGRFRNNGTITQGMNFNVTGNAEVLFADSTGSVTIPSGRSLTITDSRALVGWSGTGGATCPLVIGGTVTIKSMMQLTFSGRAISNSDVATFAADFKRGNVVSQSVSGFSGTVTEIFNLTKETGSVLIQDWTGTPANGEGLVGVGRQFTRESPFGQIGIAGAATYTMPKIAEFRSGIDGLTAPAINSTVTLQGGSILNLNVAGLASGSVHDLIVADSVTGTFGTVNITGGAGVVSYTATKVILTVT